jgi:hypothetical protein
MLVIRSIAVFLSLSLLSIPAMAASPGDLVVNEFMANPSAVWDSNGEWLELLNTTAANIDIGGWTLRDDDFDSHVIAGSVIVPAGGYAVLGRNADFTTNGGVVVDYEYSGIFLGNSGDEIVLEEGGVEIARVNYGSSDDQSGRSRALACLAPGVAQQTGYQNYGSNGPVYGAGDIGTPGADNNLAGGDLDEDGVPDACDVCPNDATDDADGDGICGNVMPCNLVVTEIMPNPDAVWDSNGEWFEVYNASDITMDMGGLTIADNAGSHLILEHLYLAPGESALLANNGDSGTNGGLTPDYVFPYSTFGGGLALGNSGDRVEVYNGGVLISSAAYASFQVEAGQSLAVFCPDCDPADPRNLGNLSAQVGPAYGDGDFGTPGDTAFEGDPDVDGLCGGDDLCPDSVPDMPTDGLGVNRWMVNAAGEWMTQGNSGGGRGPAFEVTLWDTGGCNCNDIIDGLELGNGHSKKGCSKGALEDWLELIGD